ncbi:outer membrane lipoprotein-sorting protein [Desulfobacterales bacterium HSG17]|nr:outer membrane lipoprotein-sorting protein [Desulfobacterales bacterium HSG17]
MNKCFRFMVFFFSSFVLSANIWALEMDLQKFIAQGQALHEVSDEVQKMTFFLYDIRKGMAGDQRKLEKKIKMTLWSKKFGEDQHRFLLAATEPADMAGMAIRIRQHKDQPNDLWLFHPKEQKMQRLDAGRADQFLLGTDLRLDDLTDMDPEKFNYQMLGAETLEHDGQSFNCLKIQVTLNADAGARPQRIIWLEEKRLVVLKVAEKGSNEQLIRTLTFHGYENVKAAAWRPSRILVIHHQNKHLTLVKINSRTINGNLDDSIFEERFILKGRHLK